MIMLTENVITIHRHVKEVYKFATNMENFKLWFPEVVEIESANSLDHACEGKKYLETVKIPFRGERRITLNVIKAEQNRLFITEGDFSPLLPKMMMKFSKDTPSTTTLTWSMQSRNSNPMFKIVFLPMFRKILRKRAEKGVNNLKRLMES